MTQAPLVSIIMPTYNARVGYLREALDSCLAQSYPHWELIVVDDASSNDAPAVIADYAARDSRVRVLRHAENRRLPAALNRGIRAASGTLMTWFSDDDVYRPQAMERMVAYLAEHASVDIVYTDITLVHGDGRVAGKLRVGPPEQLGISKPVGICFLARRQAFASTGFSEDLFLAEDLDFWIRAFMRFNLAPLHEDLALYRQHGGTLTQRYPRTEILQVHQRILDRHQHRMHWLDASGKAHAYLRLAKQQLRQGAPGPALSALGRAAGFGPRALGGVLADVLARRLGSAAIRDCERQTGISGGGTPS